MTESPYHRFWRSDFGDTEIVLYAIKCICNSHTEYSVDNVYHVLLNQIRKRVFDLTNKKEKGKVISLQERCDPEGG